MTEKLTLKIGRYLSVSQFTTELKKLKAYRGRAVGHGLLEALENEDLVKPRIRLRWPDPVARRFWKERHPKVSEMLDAVEPDGPRLDAAVDLYNRLQRVGWEVAGEDHIHPFDDPEFEFQQFIQHGSELAFVPYADRRLCVSNNIDKELYDRSNTEDFYSSWQVLAAAEAAEIGIHIQVNMADSDKASRVRSDIREGRFPEGRAHEIFAPSRAIRDFELHQNALDTLVWYEEECNKALTRIAIEQGGGRFKFNEEQTRSYRNAKIAAAHGALERFGASREELVLAGKFLAEKWCEWEREGRPFLAKAYKIYLALLVRYVRRAEICSLEELRDEIGYLDGYRLPALDVIWPDWSSGQKERVVRTLKGAFPAGSAMVLSSAEIDAFAEFLDTEYLDAVFLRLESFERNAFEDVPSPIGGMYSDLQGMAVAVEQAIRALGGEKAQLFQMFRQLWDGTDVGRALKRHRTLAEKSRKPDEWSEVKADINVLRDQGGANEIAADLIMTHRLRGSVHYQMVEEDQFELERLLVTLLKATAMTHAHIVRAEQAEKIEA